MAQNAGITRADEEQYVHNLTAEYVRLTNQNKELTELSCDLQQRIGQLEVLLDLVNMERDVLKERVKELEAGMEERRWR
jgi:chromosome segregation ATPase